jgi:seryl-tRNA synthetase
MIDVQDIRSRPEAYQAACVAKRIKFDITAFLDLDSQYRERRTEFETLKSKQNASSKELPKLPADEKQSKLAEMKELSGLVKIAQEELRELEEKRTSQLLRIPSIPREDVPEGPDDTANVELKTWGEIPHFDFALKDHMELGKQLGILDVERGVKVAGARSYFLVGDGARLQQALLSYASDFLSGKGYSLMAPPHLVKHEVMTGTGYFPGGEDAAYHLDERDQDTYLIGTSEVPLCAFHQGEILQHRELPKRYAGISPCYRREAGSYGKDTYGLYRVHQFFKVEQVVVCRAELEESNRLHAELLQNSESFLQSLNIPYRVVAVCTGDMGQGQVYKNDIESWMPSRKAYGETHSCSTFYDFQSRRLALRYKDEEGKNTYCHTLNNTLVASPRILIPLLELNQNEDGTVAVPEVLRPYMGGQSLIISRRP